MTPSCTSWRWAACAEGTYTLELRPTLCGHTTDSRLTWNNCARALATTTNSCASNPCERDEDGNTTGIFCCLQPSCGTDPGEPIVRFFDGTGVCDP